MKYMKQAMSIHVWQQGVSSSFELLCQDTNPSTRLTDNEADR